MIPSSDSVIIKFKVGRRLVEYNFALSKKVITIE